MKLSNIVLEGVTPADKGQAAKDLLALAKEIGSYAGISDGMGARAVVNTDGILLSYFRRDIDAAVEKYGDAIESIEVETTKYGPKAAALKINFKPGQEPEGYTAADVRSTGPLD